MAKKKVKRRVQRVFRKKPCRLCRDKIKSIDYKDVDFLSKFISEKGRIIPTRITGNCAKHQRMVAAQIKRARVAALLPFVRVKESTRMPFARGRRQER
jgi:small subunit ribosomal protein S18